MGNSTIPCDCLIQIANASHLSAVNLLNGINVNGLGEVALDSQTIMNQNQNLMTIGNYDFLPV